jgi:ADP-ribose pyrophosphatase YjhB (NUDIX family)
MVVGALCVWQEGPGRDKILLCRRAIEPRVGLWTLPAGYMELGETPEEAARRETREEAGGEIEIDALLAIYALPHISQVQLIYLARLSNLDIAAGPESAEVRLFDWADLPRDEIAFPSIHWALDRYAEVGGNEPFQPATNPRGETGEHRA